MPARRLENSRRFSIAPSGGSGGPPAAAGGTIVAVADDALELVGGFARLQEALLGVWLETFHVTELWISFRRAPREGAIELAGEPWTFMRHGAGVRFESPRGEVVEAHDCIFEAPRGVDGWRIHLFCESRGIAPLTFAGEAHAVSDYRRVEELLQKMHVAGQLVHANVDRARYVPTTP